MSCLTDSNRIRHSVVARCTHTPFFFIATVETCANEQLFFFPPRRPPVPGMRLCFPFPPRARPPFSHPFIRIVRNDNVPTHRFQNPVIPRFLPDPPASPPCPVHTSKIRYSWLFSRTLVMKNHATPRRKHSWASFPSSTLPKR